LIQPHQKKAPDHPVERFNSFTPISMKRLHPYLRDAQGQAYESRPDRAKLYPNHRKAQAWQANYSGVTKLAAVDRRFWVNGWSNPYRLRLCEKDGPIKTSICQLAPVDEEGRYTGQLQLFDKDSRSRFQLRVWLRETGQRWLEVHFEVISVKEGK
jgi:hypothetical protein